MHTNCVGGFIRHHHREEGCLNENLPAWNESLETHLLVWVQLDMYKENGGQQSRQADSVRSRGGISEWRSKEKTFAKECELSEWNVRFLPKAKRFFSSPLQSPKTTIKEWRNRDMAIEIHIELFYCAANRPASQCNLSFFYSKLFYQPWGSISKARARNCLWHMKREKKIWSKANRKHFSFSGTGTSRGWLCGKLCSWGSSWEGIIGNWYQMDLSTQIMTKVNRGYISWHPNLPYGYHCKQFVPFFQRIRSDGHTDPILQSPRSRRKNNDWSGLSKCSSILAMKRKYSSRKVILLINDIFDTCLNGRIKLSWTSIATESYGLTKFQKKKCHSSPQIFSLLQQCLIPRHRAVSQNFQLYQFSHAFMMNTQLTFICLAIYSLVR